MLFKTIAFFITPIIIVFLLASPVHTCYNKAADLAFSDSILKTCIAEEKFILINGIKQWLTIKGESTKPVILFLHGGPGSPISPYSDNLYKEWEKDFIIVQWDQRGSGKTFGLTAPPELTPEFLRSNPLHLEEMTTDGIELTEYLLKHLGKKKIILFGTSWGSALGVKMVTKRPQLYYAYVGHSQIVDPSDDLPLYNTVYQMAQKKMDTASLKILNDIGKPPYDKASNTGRLLRVVKKYETANSIPPPDSWFIEAPQYGNAKDRQGRNDGDDYSFVNYTGDKKLDVVSMRSSINLLRDNLNFKMPVYLIQGEEDLLTPKSVTKNYFNKIKAPAKSYILLPNAAHGFNLAVLEAQYKIFKRIKI